MEGGGDGGEGRGGGGGGGENGGTEFVSVSGAAAGGGAAAALSLFERCFEPGIPCHCDRRARERRSRARRIHDARAIFAESGPQREAVFSAGVQRRARKQAQPAVSRCWALREAVLKDGGTVVSDGWDDVAKNHLINFLCGNSKGFFFDGTIKLTSEDSENADKVAELICDEIENVGALSIVQVVTDTCSVMKAAWKVIEKKFPWITCTCSAHLTS